ncbi:trissin [Anoplophora glabripennis]|uniref:trissin n=1 Tax=Anoplophora glabripennis TaxID=217634 RepID=UPI0008757E9D|nr:trissin [Anoplophora glabripennis]
MTRELTVVALIFILGVVWGEAQSCNSCGSECQSACGTRHFRTCCFNYLKKRSPNPDPLPQSMDPSLRLELWLARSRYPYFQQRNILDNSLEVSNDVGEHHNHDSQMD